MRASQTFIVQNNRVSNFARANISKFLQECGYFKSTNPGFFAWLPLGIAVVNKIQAIIQGELIKTGATEIRLPIMGNRRNNSTAHQNFRTPGEQFFSIDRNGQGLALASTFEESLVEWLKGLLQGQSQLPIRFFHQQTKVRDLEFRPNDIFTARERHSVDCYGVYSSYTGMNNDLPKLFKLAMSVFQICSLKPLVAEGLPVYLGGAAAQDFIVTSRNGDYSLVYCEKCGYSADRNVAIGLSKFHNFKLLPLVEDLRADVSSTEELIRQVGIPGDRLGKCQLWVSEKGLIMTVVRGDQKIGLAKLGQGIGIPVLGPLDEAAYAEYGFVPQFLSPLNLNLDDLAKRGITVVVDQVVAETPNILLGCNARGRYAANANFGRDFDCHVKADICLVDEGNRCYHCGGGLKVQSALKLASLNRVGDYYSQIFGTTFTADNGLPGYPFLSSLVFNIERIMAALAQVTRDKRGLRWPLPVAPFPVSLLAVGKSAKLLKLAQSVYAGISDMAFWDDRAIPISDKFKEADRMGIPIRIILSARSLDNSQAVVINRFERAIEIIDIDKLPSYIYMHCDKHKTPIGMANAF